MEMAHPRPSPPPDPIPTLCQQQLIPTIIDRHDVNDPRKVWVSIPHDNDNLHQGFRDITYRQFRNAVDKASYWLDSKLGASTKGSFATFAYYGPRDLRYAILLVAAMKTGLKVGLCIDNTSHFLHDRILPTINTQMLSSSLLCALDAHVHLVKATDCHVFLCTKSTLQLVEKIESQQSSARHFIVPDLLDFLPIDESESDDWPVYPYDSTWDAAKDDPCLVVHTSGSTGVPKVVVYTHRMLANPDRHRHLSPVNGCPMLLWEMAGRRLFTTIPIFHVSASDPHT
jgi:acyl-CoA synthetase (AMP-forming)/AMP-acid ligase II